MFRQAVFLQVICPWLGYYRSKVVLCFFAHCVLSFGTHFQFSFITNGSRWSVDWGFSMLFHCKSVITFSFWRYIEIVWTTLNFSVCTFVSGFYSAGYIWYSCLFLLRWQSHCMKLTILKCTIWWHLIIHSSVKPPPLPSSRMFSSPQKENLCPFSSPLHSSFPSVACNHQSASYLCYPIVDILYNCCCTIRNLLYFCLAAFS